MTSATHADPKVLGRVVELAHPRPGQRALDVGTGTGHTAFALAPRVTWVVGLDLTPGMLEQGMRQRRERNIVNVSFETGDVHDLPYADSSFDIVTCRRAAHHFSNIERAIAEMSRVLVPGGRLVIDDRASPDDDRGDAVMDRLDRVHDPSHVRQYRPREWQRLLEGAGFGVYAIEPYTQARPVTSLTAGVPDAGVAEVRSILAGLDPETRHLLGVADVDGEPHSLHFYVTIAATRGAR